jgi:hypothetical protein
MADNAGQQGSPFEKLSMSFAEHSEGENLMKVYSIGPGGAEPPLPPPWENS